MISVTVFLVGVTGVLLWPPQKGFRVMWSACHECLLWKRAMKYHGNPRETKHQHEALDWAVWSFRFWRSSFVYLVCYSHPPPFIIFFFLSRKKKKKKEKGKKKVRLNGITKTSQHPTCMEDSGIFFSFPLKIFLNTHPCPNPNEYSSYPSNPFPNTRSSSCRVFYLAAGASLRGKKAAGKIL